jgi:putative transposase
MQGSLSVERMCRVAGVSRASFYRWLEPCTPVEEEMEVRVAIQAVVLEHRRRYGYRRVTRELRRRGLLVNHKPGSPQTGLRPWGGSVWRG